MKLQINTSGAWKNVVEFDAKRKAEVINAVKNLADILGDSASWCILHDTGKREWLKQSLASGFATQFKKKRSKHV